MALTDRAGMTSSTTGTGTITLGSALGAVPVLAATFNTFANSGCIDGQTYSYLILDTPNWEYGRGTYTASGTTLSRGAIYSSSGSATAISLSGNQQVFVSLLKEDVREVLLANRTYYVRTDGSNSNNGFANTAGGAFLTIQKAWDTILTLDLNSFTATIQIADGTYTTAVSIVSPPFGGLVTIQGNSGTPANVIISTTSANCFSISAVLPGVLTIKDLKMQTTTSGSCIYHAGVGAVSILNVNFGACAGSHMWTNKPGADISNAGSYAISGAAAAHVRAGVFSTISIVTAGTITITGTPAFSSAFAWSIGGLAAFETVTFSGSATGTRWLFALDGGVYATMTLPGNADGAASSYPTGFKI